MLYAPANHNSGKTISSRDARKLAATARTREGVICAPRVSLYKGCHLQPRIPIPLPTTTNTPQTTPSATTAYILSFFLFLSKLAFSDRSTHQEAEKPTVWWVLYRYRYCYREWVVYRFLQWYGNVCELGFINDSVSYLDFILPLIFLWIIIWRMFDFSSDPKSLSI